MFMKKVNNDDKTRWLNYPDPAWLLEDFKLQIHLKKPYQQVQKMTGPPLLKSQ